MPLALLALTISAFAIGTTEFVIVGLIPTIASDVHVSIPTAGLLVSLYALGVAIGAPILTAVTGKIPRKLLLLLLMAFFTAGNLLAWLSPTYSVLIAARVLTGVTHGVFFSIGSTIATSLVPKDKAASAIATMFNGLTVALVTGVPLGTFIGQRFGWHETFLAVSILGLIGLIGCLIFVPKKLHKSKDATIAEQLSILKEPRLLLVYAMTAASWGGTFIVFTFLAPLLEEITGFESSAISWVMLVYGVSVAFGNICGGKLADSKGPIRALQIIFALLAMVLFMLTFTITNKWLTVLTIFAWGAVAFGNTAALQVYVVQKAEQLVPKAMDVASGLNIAAFNVGIAMGAWTGGVIVMNLGLRHTTWVGAIIVAIAFLLTSLSGKLDAQDTLLHKPRRSHHL